MSGQALLEAALNRDHVPHRGGVVHGAAESQAVADRGRQLVEQHVAAAVHADQVRIRHPDHIDAVGAQPLADGRHVGLRRVRHRWLQPERSDTNDLAA
jgi:hypothetical protein